MPFKSRGHGQNQEWNPMRDEYNNSMNDSLYGDENGSSGKQLDYNRLYITNVPKELSEGGIRASFSRFGTITDVIRSTDPTKDFALVRFETAGEAKYAMSKMNRTPPLHLKVSIARQPVKNNKKKNKENSSYGDDGSVGSRGNNRNNNDSINCNNMDELPAEDEVGTENTLNAELHLELENIKLEQLKVREEQLQCKQRMLLLKQADKRSPSQNASNIQCVLPDGRIVARNMHFERSTESRDGDVSFGAGDSQLTIPGLQRECSTACVWCGSRADMYCSRCALAPYCSSGCQQRDWRERHRNVCHNLARLKSANGVKELEKPEPVMQPAAPLRQLHPATQAAHREPARQNEVSPADFNQKSNQQLNLYRQPVRNQKEGRGGNRNYNGRTSDKRPLMKQDISVEDEDWDLEDKTPATDPKQPTPQNAQALELPKPFQRQVPAPVTKKPTPAVTNPTPVVWEPKPAMREPMAMRKKPMMKEPDLVTNVSKVVKTTMKEPAISIDVTPGKKLVPECYVMEKLSIGDEVVVTVESNAADCRSNTPGFICVTLNEQYEADYQKLCEQYAMDCEADAEPYTTTPGETFSYFNPEDAGWYRARCLTPTLAALFDSGKLVNLQPSDRCRKLPSAYEAIPEFCCVLNADMLKLGDNMKCIIKLKRSVGIKVDIQDIATGMSVGSGVVTKWLPEIEYPVSNAVASGSIPEVSRPDVRDQWRVVLVRAPEPATVFVRGASNAEQNQFESILQEVVLYGMNASPLQEPPRSGQTVIAMCKDGMHYRALCKRTNVKQNKYLLEFIEHGNTEMTTLEKLYPCPPQLDVTTVPAQTSYIRLLNQPANFTNPAIKYLDDLKENGVELILTITSGVKTAPNGSLVILTVAKNRENVNIKVADMCKPDWKKLEDEGTDIVETDRLMHTELRYAPIPAGAARLRVLDVSALEHATVSACPDPLADSDYIFTVLSQRMGEYCDSEIGKEPYLPKAGELCIAQCPPYPQWFRAIMLELDSGPGSSSARLCFIDYGNVDLVPVKLIRKMLPEFVKNLPAVASLVEIKDFPKMASPEILTKAIEYMKFDEKGDGKLPITRCIQKEEGMYIVEAPGLLAAMSAN